MFVTKGRSNQALSCSFVCWWHIFYWLIFNKACPGLAYQNCINLMHCQIWFRQRGKAGCHSCILLVVIYMRNFANLRIIVSIHMDAHEYIYIFFFKFEYFMYFGGPVLWSSFFPSSGPFRFSVSAGSTTGLVLVTLQDTISLGLEEMLPRGVGKSFYFHTCCYFLGELTPGVRKSFYFHTCCYNGI